MPKKIFEGENDSDSDIEIKTNNDYAKNYDIWRKKEVLNRLKAKYGEDLEEETSSSSDDDDNGVELTEEVEKQFFKTLSYLKNKDPRIYDESVRFFENSDGKSEKTLKKKKEKPMYINDYERELILNKNGALSDGDEEIEDSRARSPTYVEEQKKLKESFKEALGEVSEGEDDEEWGGVLKARHKTEEEKIKEEEEYKEWLAGQKTEITDKEAESELKPLKDYWSNPKLDDGEKFLRDYILKKKFLSNEDEDYIPTYEEIIHDSDKDLSEDEQAIDKQEEFEHKYNFRFEEPDQEFIKRYPRTMEHSLRKTDDRRKIKRAETKERKQNEKQQKMQELKKLQELKRKEIEEKIQKLKEITGNENIGFNDEDLDGDFDPEAHDKRMQSLFNDEFYEGPEGDEKPKFPEIDEYLELENWEKWNGEENHVEDTEEEERMPHCEDEDFNMDCDYDPQTSTKQELIENSKGKKKRKRKSLFAKAVSQPKPVFDPNDKTYEEYLDEYYKLDCEDIVGDIPCRFKYRQVVPNSFGLTVEEILAANDRELNRWCSLKKAVQHRPDHVEKYDQIAFAKKASNIALKKKILPSLFQNEEKVEEERGVGNKEKKGKKKVKDAGNIGEGVGADEKEINEEKTDVKKSKKVKRKNKKLMVNQEPDVNIVEDRGEKDDSVLQKSDVGNVSENEKKKGKKNYKKGNSAIGESKKISKRRKHVEEKSDDIPKKKIRKCKEIKNNVKDVGISDARLTAYGINPKKFKNKIKYGKK